MPRLPDVLTESDLSVAELHAAKLDGALLPIGDGFRAIDRPDGRPQRLAALLPTLPARVVVSEESAAWVWGALADAPEPLRLSAALRQRARLIVSTTMIVREVRFTPGDIVMLDADGGGAVAVTSRVRTAVDLARAADRPSAAAALRGMFTTRAASPDDVKMLLLAHVRLAGRTAAIAAVETARPPGG